MGNGRHLHPRPLGRNGRNHRPRAAMSGTLLATVVLAAGVQAPAASAAPILPDLVSDAPGTSIAPETYVDSQGTRLLVRFDGFVHNAGQGPLELRASNRSGDLMQTVVQRANDGAGGTTDLTRIPKPTIRFESADGHNHWHLKNAVSYSLWNNAKTAIAAPSMKVGFCLVDGEPVDAFAPPAPSYDPQENQYCRREQPTATDVYMGISPGWRDVYSRDLAFQWVDISDVAPGSYWLRSNADPDNVVIESNETNPPAYGAYPSVVNGYLAQPVNAGGVGTWSTKMVNLTATKYDDMWAGSPGAVQYKIVTAPAKGTLSQPVGTWFTASQVKYTPRFGQSGADSFTFAARDGASAFPRNARTATASITISGLFGARSTARAAATSRLPAPAALQLPAPSGEPRPAPSVRAAAVPRRGLSKVRLARHARSLIATVAAGQSGRVRLVATRDGVPIGGCSAAVRRGTAATCKIALSRSVAPRALICRIPRTTGLRLPGVKVTATLTSAGKVRVARTARAR